MEGVFILLAILAVCCLLSGPVALIIAIIALNNSRQKRSQLRTKSFTADSGTQVRQMPIAKQPIPQIIKPPEPDRTGQHKQKIPEDLSKHPAKPQKSPFVSE